MTYDISSVIEKGLIKDHCLAEISEFGAPLQKANENLVPVFALTNEQMNASGTVLDQMTASKKRFYGLFNIIAEVILELV
ncbi:hypothetical protein D3C81_1991380 [compost metagenome]